MRLVSLIWLVAPALCAQVAIRQQDSKVTVAIDGKPYTEFVYGSGVTKPYLDPLRAASGTVMTRRFPMQTGLGETTDHPEHRGVWFGHTDVNGFNFYANEPSFTTPNRGRIVVQKIDHIRSGKKSGAIQATLAWLDPAGNTLLIEKREMIFYSGGRERVLDFDFKLTAAVKVKFGDHRDGGFSIRVTDALQERHTGLMVSADGCQKESGCWGKTSNWMDYSGEVDGAKLGIAILDHPSNPHHPVRWQARGYGLFAPNPFGAREFTHGQIPDGSVTLEAGQTLHLRYRVIIHPGDAQAAKLDAAYAKYALQ
jgi:hypothetical protein